jgi:hypothetical protein
MAAMLASSPGQGQAALGAVGRVVVGVDDGHIAMVQPDQYARIIPVPQHTKFMPQP